jgi:hypothetical protein
MFLLHDKGVNSTPVVIGSMDVLIQAERLCRHDIAVVLTDIIVKEIILKKSHLKRIVPHRVVFVGHVHHDKTGPSCGGVSMEKTRRNVGD